MPDFDVIGIGAGTGGYVAAIRAAQLGLKTAVVEKQKALGGTCLLWGCIPTKALLEHAHALKVVQHAKDWGVTIGGSTLAGAAIDMPQVQTRKDRIVSGLSKGVEFLFKKHKIDWIKGTARLTGNGGGVDITVQLADGQAKALRADYLLVATGRGPVTTGLNAEGVGLQLEKGYVRVDAMYRTNVPGISAIGDVITLGSAGHPQLAHVSSAEGIIAAERIAGHETRPLNYDHVPGCTYCDPEIGSVGLTEDEAKARGYEVRVGTFPFGVLGRAKMAGETDGFVNIVAEKKYDEVLGGHMIGLRATELVAEATLALRLESTVEERIRTIHAHPTMAEAVGEAAHAAHGEAIDL